MKIGRMAAMRDELRARQLLALAATGRPDTPSLGDILAAFTEVRTEERNRVHASMLSLADQLESFGEELEAAGHGRSDARVALAAAAIKIRRAAIGYTLAGEEWKP